MHCWMVRYCDYVAEHKVVFDSNETVGMISPPNKYKQPITNSDSPNRVYV